MLRMPHSSSTSRTPGPALTPVPGPAGARDALLPPEFRRIPRGGGGRNEPRPLFMRLKLKAALAGGVGEGLDTAVIAIVTAVKCGLANALGLGVLRQFLTNENGCLDVAAALHTLGGRTGRSGQR